MKKILLEINFKKQNVKVFENRIEIEFKENLTKLCTKGLTGKFIIYLKHLVAIEIDKNSGIIEFMTPAQGHIAKSLVKSQADNNIVFNKKEIEFAEKLINTINELI